MEIDKKRIYVTPFIESIRLDNEISLSLESSPPEGPLESLDNIEFYNNDPMKISTT